MTASVLPSEVKGYHSVLYTVSPSPFFRFLYVRKHKAKASDATLPGERTLFVTNLPRGVSEQEVTRVASAFGAVEAVHLAKAGATAEAGGAGAGLTAHVVLSEASAVKKALAWKKALSFSVSDDQEGLPTMTARPAPSSERAQLKASVNSFMAEFEAQEAEEKATKDAQHNGMDDDGFTLVTRKSKGRSTTTEAETGAQVQVSGGVNAYDPNKKKKKKKDTSDFYHFQRHEKKREQLLNLRQQFEQDKSKIEAMKAQRKFRPY